MASQQHHRGVARLKSDAIVDTQIAKRVIKPSDNPTKKKISKAKAANTSVKRQRGEEELEYTTEEEIFLPKPINRN